MSDLHSEFHSLWKDINPALARLVAEARELREVERPHVGDTVTAIRERAVTIRGNLDRLEQITADIGRLRARAEQATAEAKDAYDDKVAGVINQTKQVEFSTGVERNAGYATKAFNELLVWRQAKKRLAEVVEAHEFCKMLHRGLDSARRDEHVLFNMLSIETRLES